MKIVLVSAHDRVDGEVRYVCVPEVTRFLTKPDAAAFWGLSTFTKINEYDKLEGIFVLGPLFRFKHLTTSIIGYLDQ